LVENYERCREQMSDCSNQSKKLRRLRNNSVSVNIHFTPY